MLWYEELGVANANFNSRHYKIVGMLIMISRRERRF